jgi:hypothetical protein
MQGILPNGSRTNLASKIAHLCQLMVLLISLTQLQYHHDPHH